MITPEQTIKFTTEVFDIEWMIQIDIFKDDEVVVHAESITDFGSLDLMEDIVQDTIRPSVKDIVDAIEYEQERRYDEWAERQAERY